jgi:hypothetical protein
VESYHSIKEKMGLPLGNRLCGPIFRNEDRELPEMGFYKIPDSCFRARFELKAVLESSIRFISGNDQVSLYGIAANNLLK